MPKRSRDIKLNCTLVANPEATVSWQFLPRESIPGSIFEQLGKNSGANHSKQTQLYLDGRAPSDWISINHLAAYTVIFDNPRYNQDYKYEDYYESNLTSNFTLFKLPISKYQISDKHSGHNVISSVLEMNVRLRQHVNQTLSMIRIYFIL